MKKLTSTLLAMILAITGIFILASCNKPDGSNTPTNETNLTDENTNNNENEENNVSNNPIATITMKNGGIIVVELYPDVAPNTVNNFISLANSGFYDGKIFHRVIPGFMIQGSDPDGTGMGGPDYSIKGEFALNNFVNNLKHTRGVISMARSNPYDSAGSQFFIMVDTATHLDGSYAAFGKVTEGMDVVDEIVNTESDAYTNRPYDDQIMASVRVETNGIKFPAPEIIK